MRRAIAIATTPATVVQYADPRDVLEHGVHPSARMMHWGDSDDMHDWLPKQAIIRLPRRLARRSGVTMADVPRWVRGQAPLRGGSWEQRYEGAGLGQPKELPRQQRPRCKFWLDSSMPDWARSFMFTRRTVPPSEP